MRLNLLAVALLFGCLIPAAGQGDPHAGGGHEMSPHSAPSQAPSPSIHADGMDEGTPGAEKDEHVAAMTARGPATRSDWEAAHQEFHRTLNEARGHPQLPTSGQELLAKILETIEAREHRLEEWMPSREARPEDRGKGIAYLKAMGEIAVGGRDLSIANEALNSFRLPAQACARNPECARAQQEKARADDFVDRAFMETMPQIVHTSMMRALGGALFKAGWNDHGPSAGAPPTPPGVARRSHNQVMAGYNDPDAQVYVGNELARSGDLTGAQSAFSKALSMSPNDLDALTGRADARYNMGDFAGAFEDARGALRVDPSNQRAKETAFHAQGRLEEMRAPTGANPWSDSGDGARLAGNTAGPAVQAGGQGREFAGWMDEARRAFKIGDLDAARRALDRAVGINPANVDAHASRAWTHAMQGRMADAVKDITSILRLDPKGGPAAARKVAADLLRRKRYGEAKGVLELIAPDQRDGATWFALAAAENGLGNRGGVFDALKHASSLDAGRYGAAYQRALSAAPSEDLSFLFEEAPGDAGSAAREPGKGGRDNRLWLTILAMLAGGLLVALGVVTSRREGWTTRIRRAVVAETPGEGPEPAPAALGADNLVDNFELVRQIGLGGMGIVYEGLDRSLGRRVAIKKMREEIRVDLRERERFLAEAKTVAKLQHPNIVAIHAIKERGDDVYLVFEFVEGATLYEILDRRGRLPLKEATRVAEQAGEALAYAHARDIIHRDLKPSNVMLDSGGAVKVMDFGVARQAKDAVSKLSMTNTIVGTPPYMAPEQEQGVVCKESDVYALAVCFYELVTGRLPFQGIGAGMLLNKMNKSYAPATTLAPELPAGLDGFFAKAFEPEPNRRFRSVGELLSALRSVTAAR